MSTMSSQIHKLQSYIDKIAQYKFVNRGFRGPSRDVENNIMKITRKLRKKQIKFYTRQTKRNSAKQFI